MTPSRIIWVEATEGKRPRKKNARKKLATKVGTKRRAGRGLLWVRMALRYEGRWPNFHIIIAHSRKRGADAHAVA